LGGKFGVELPPTIIFDYPTVGALASYLAQLVPTPAEIEEDEVSSFADSDELGYAERAMMPNYQVSMILCMTAS
jgi:hypothetical protein